MAFLTEDAPRPEGRRVGTVGLVVGATLLLLAIAGLLAYGLLYSSPPTPSDPPHPADVRARRQSLATGSLDIATDVPGARIILDGKTLGEGPRLVEGLTAGVHHLRVELAGYETWEQDAHIVPNVATRLRARLARPAARLHVESDVSGASVFLDRKFCGRTPLDLTELATGAHRLSVSAEGYDMYELTLDLAPGTKTVSVRLKDVRLDEALDVVHRHALGSCAGRLSATAAGLRYETSNAKDSFAVPFSALERLDVDYLGKTLVVKLRAGRRYDFGVKEGGADPLVVFQQRVDHARERLAAAVP